MPLVHRYVLAWYIYSQPPVGAAFLFHYQQLQVLVVHEYQSHHEHLHFELYLRSMFYETVGWLELES